jgi:alcohol dehydrogenase (cytochrome c)
MSTTPKIRQRQLFKRRLLVSLTLSTLSLAAQHGGAATGADEWNTPLGTVQGARYSTLSEITNTNASNVYEERVILTGTKRGHEGAPLVINVPGVGVRMFAVTPWPNKLIATDTQGNVAWTFAPKTSAYAQGQACCDVVNRGASFFNDGKSGLIIYSRLDGVVNAVNAATGKLVWQTTIANVKAGETLPGAPLVAGNKVIVGNAGGEMGVRGWLQALDANTGKVLWKGYNTGPDKDVLITTNTKNFYAKDRGVDLGQTTWTAGGTMGNGSSLWQQGGATVWAWITYDPDTDTTYYGTANPGVWDPDMRPGDNKWSSAIIARNASTGEVKWATQLTPHDNWDFDAMNESIVVPSLPGLNSTGKVLMHFNKNGFAFAMDASTGQILSANKFVNATWASGYDLSTGLPALTSTSAVKEGVPSAANCPSPLGGKEFAPASYSSSTGLFYIPAINFCASLEGLKTNYIAGTPFMGANLNFAPDGANAPGALIAWNPSGSAAWSKIESVPLYGGVLSTAGNIVAYATLDRHFKILDAVTGTELKSLPLECGSIGNPISYLGSDGKQRIAVYSGIGWLPSGFAGGVCPGPSNTKGQANGGYGSGAIHVFRLP